MQQSTLLIEVDDADGKAQFTESTFQIFPQDGTYVVLENGERYIVVKTYSKLITDASSNPPRLLPVVKLKHKPKKRRKS